jgi:hypothetical protein
MFAECRRRSRLDRRRHHRTAGELVHGEVQEKVRRNDRCGQLRVERFEVRLEASDLLNQVREGLMRIDRVPFLQTGNSDDFDVPREESKTQCRISRVILVIHEFMDILIS